MIGRSGLGKSSFFHNVVLGGCLKYSPRDLQFWLLDFKNGGASSKYSNCGIPHIKIISENNKLDDAFCLFNMILEEMERRNKAFNELNVADIIEYNKKAKMNTKLEYFPRIIIAIDEIQELFRDNEASEIQKLIASISTRMRSSGMHFIIVAQNLSDGKSFMLNNAFTNHVSGRVCFRVVEDTLGESGFNDSFKKRKQEISSLNTGEAFVSYGGDTIEKVKMSFVPVEDICNSYARRIIEKYPLEEKSMPLVIGSKKKLSVNMLCQKNSVAYSDILRLLDCKKGFKDVVVGEDVYRMIPKEVRFWQNDNSSLLFLGSDRIMSSSLCTSVVLSLVNQNVKMHLFNGDKTPVVDDNGEYEHPFMYICKNATKCNSNIINHKLNQFKYIINNLYLEMRKRESQQQMAEDSINYENVFLVINDLFGIQSFCNNEEIYIKEREMDEKELIEKYENNYTEDFFCDSVPFDTNDSWGDKLSSIATISIQEAFRIMIEKGYKYNIHIIVSINRNYSSWNPGKFISSSRVILFNDNDFVSEVEESYYVKEMLKNISNNGNDETLAVWLTQKSLSKIRPLIYDLSNKNERMIIDSIMMGGGD